MKPEEKHIIWSNFYLDYDDWKDELEADYPDLCFGRIGWPLSS